MAQKAQSRTWFVYNYFKSCLNWEKSWIHWPFSIGGNFWEHFLSIFTLLEQVYMVECRYVWKNTLVECDLAELLWALCNWRNAILCFENVSLHWTGRFLDNLSYWMKRWHPDLTPTERPLWSGKNNFLKADIRRRTFQVFRFTRNSKFLWNFLDAIWS